MCGCKALITEIKALNTAKHKQIPVNQNISNPAYNILELDNVIPFPQIWGVY